MIPHQKNIPVLERHDIRFMVQSEILKNAAAAVAGSNDHVLFKIWQHRAVYISIVVLTSLVSKRIPLVGQALKMLLSTRG